MNDAEFQKLLLINEQVYLWDELVDSIRSAQNGYWSMACETKAQRIIRIAKIVGITPTEHVYIPLLKWGIYKAICEKVGAVYDYDESKLDQYEAYFGHPRMALAVPYISKLEELEVE